jgi:hypothetical protein
MCWAVAISENEEGPMEAKKLQGGKGDRIIVKAHHVGESPRTGVVLEVLGKPDHVHYRVRWEDDGHESIFTPSSDATFEHTAGRS